MNTSQLESTWGALKGKLKQHYGQLTDDDLTFAEGKGEELLSRLQEKLGISREELELTLDDLASTAHGKLEEVKTKAAEFSDQVRARAGDVVEDLKQRATAIGEDAKAQGVAAYDEARQRARGLWEDGEEYVRANPRDSLLVQWLPDLLPDSFSSGANARRRRAGIFVSSSTRIFRSPNLSAELGCRSHTPDRLEA